MDHSTPPHVVIIGCGFGGLAAARVLGRAAVRVTLIDRSNHHLFQPLLYQVATGGLSAPAIASPIRHLLRRLRNTVTVMAEVSEIDVSARRVVTDRGAYDYDYLIVAAGAATGWFGHDDWARHASSLKSLDDALAIRSRLLTAFELAETETDNARRQALTTFAVVGGGPTGVEMAGTMMEIARHTLKAEFRRIDPASTRVLLIEGSPRVLGTFDPNSSDKARRQLERLGVDVRTGWSVTQIDATGLTARAPDGAERRIDAATVIWAAGVRASPLASLLAGETDRAGRVRVRPDLSLPEHTEVYAVGDLATVPTHLPPIPGVGPAAKQMGRRAAHNLLARIAGRPTSPFRYVDWGALATIGRHSAVAELGRLRFSGLPAWLFWLFVHVFFLIGFRNRIIVMTDWAWSYVTFDRFARIIVGRTGRPGPTDS